MTTVRMKADLRPFGTIAGHEPPAPGEVFDVPEDEARRMVAAGQAEPLDGSPEVDFDAVPSLWPGTFTMSFPAEGRAASSDINTDGRALTGRTGLGRQEEGQ